ncbi:MAG: hypothetical protein JWM98_1685, partial [Thermoleophilia bacterium]|nr:hypothetical protein [Thermoleophilia bacterium]
MASTPTIQLVIVDPRRTPSSCPLGTPSTPRPCARFPHRVRIRSGRGMCGRMDDFSSTAPVEVADANVARLFVELLDTVA